MKKLKKLFITLIIACLVIIAFGEISNVKAESAGPMYLGIVSLRRSGYGYTQSGKKVWKIAQYTSTNEQEVPDKNKTIYCIKAGPGFGSTDMMTGGIPKISTYTQKFNLKDLTSIPSPYKDVLPTGENYNKLMWLLDNIYILPEIEDVDAKNAYLRNIIPEENYGSITTDEIDVIQQLAVWYFTNSTDIYHYSADEINLFRNAYINQDDNYKNFEDLFGDAGLEKVDALKELYRYYITNAKADYVSENVNTKPIELVSSEAKMQTINSNYVAGPYKLNKLLDVNYQISTSYTDINGKSITPELGEKDSSGNIIKTNKTIDELVGQEFYLIMPVSSDISGMKMIVNSSYKARTTDYWSVADAPNTEQPVVVVDETTQNFSEETSIVVPKPFDLSLRKFIIAVNGKEVETREPEVNVKALAAGTATTATYNHTKNPIKVQIGDEVTYKIRVYNEGSEDGYVSEITDHLPEQLEFLKDDPINQQYGWHYAGSADLKTLKTSYLSKENETSDGENKISAFNGETLDYKEVQIKCKVVNTNPMVSKITNLADITGFTDANGNKVTDRDSQENNVIIPTGTELENYKDPEINRGDKYIPGQQDDDDFEKLIIKEFDLSLRKFITGVNDEEITSRIPEVNVQGLAAGTSSTAVYNHPKTPVAVGIGDKVTYTIRVYNEGDVAGYASEITDHIPAQLKYLPNDSINKQYEWEMLDKDGNVTTDVNSAVKIRTSYLSRNKETNDRQNKITAFNGKELAYKDVKITFEVIQTNPMAKKITNLADITDFEDENGNKVTDRDSQENNVVVPSGTELENYKDNEITNKYIPGQQDDDDFEKLIIKEFDLSLRKFITKVNDTQITSRIPQVDVKPLINGSATTANYNHSKEPIKVSVGSVVEYTIRVYNEGQIDGYASEIKDHIPEQLEYLPDNNTNKKYEWIMIDKDGNTTNDVNKAVVLKTGYLSKDNETTTRNNVITAFDGTTLDYKDVKIAFKVKQTDPMPSKITNIADISDFEDKNGDKVTDRDSQEDNVKIPDDLPGYKDDKIKDTYIPGQQDDDDFEKISIAEFDLSLRKFITAVNDTEITSRIPQVDVTHLKDGSSTTADYNHPKDPVLVSNGNIVTYTIRVFNEGDMDGYASLIKDDIPEGLEFLPDNDINKTYRWKMIDKDGDETEKIEDAVSIVTDYLSKAQEKSAGENLLKAFDSEKDELSFKDVKVAFKVIEPSTSDRIIINQAEISKNSDKYDNEVTDRDSIPDKWNEGEDDQDIEKIKVQYFDLALRKWVTQTIVIENGNEKVTETGHTAEDDPEAVAKVDLKKSKLNKVTVKFRFKIRVRNEGNIAGYAKEIKDYIPDGLKFVKEDNPLWTQLDDKTIVTDQAKDTLLAPGDETVVEVLLTWINSEENMKVMDNWAEISKDYNEYGSPDIDSTPNNNKHGEDDIDDAPVMVTIQTGQIVVYFAITLGVLLIITSGLVLIKKYVI